MEGKVKFKVNKEDKAKEKRQIRFLIAVKYTSSCSIVSHNAKHLKLCSNNTYILFQRERKNLNFSHCRVAICNCQSQMLIRKSSITNCHTANDRSVSFPKRSLTLLLTNVQRLIQCLALSRTFLCHLQCKNANICVPGRFSVLFPSVTVLNIL